MFRIKKSKKQAQAWFSDFTIALIIFTVTAAIFLGYFHNSMEIKNNKYEDILNDAKTISNQIVTAGSPVGWTNDTAVIIGISQDDKENFIDNRKLSELSKMNYSFARKTFGIKYDYALFLKDGGDCIIPIEGKNWIGKQDITVSAANDLNCSLGEKLKIDVDSFDSKDIVKTERIFVYNASLIKAEVYTWQ